MSAAGIVVVAPVAGSSDTELVARVRAGDDAAFEELFRRYRLRIAAFVHRLVRDEGRAEDVTQEAFLSALRRMRATESEIVFKPWIYEIARNAAIDSWRRVSRAEVVSIDHEDQLRPSDRGRLVGAIGPDSALIAKERMDHLRGALDELSDTHHRVIVMRELEGLSYREIGERLELTRPAVESTLFRARRRLEHEYGELETGSRCDSIMEAIARMAEGMESDGDSRRLARHARLCGRCRRRARQLGVEPLALRRVARRAAALLPLPALLRRRGSGGSPAEPASGAQAGSSLAAITDPFGEIGAAVAERTAALVAAVALAGAGGAVLGGAGPYEGLAPSGGDRTDAQQRQAGGADGGSSHPRPAEGLGDRKLEPRRAPRSKARSGARRGRGGKRGTQAQRRRSGSKAPGRSTVPAPARPRTRDPRAPGAGSPTGGSGPAAPPDVPRLEGAVAPGAGVPQLPGPTAGSLEGALGAAASAAVGAAASAARESLADD
jgi:RNA polymerase sigma factor (sigma-70 family)